jgi:enolase
MISSAEFAIAEVFAWEALDSRGTPTVASRVHLAGGGVGRAVVPSGASTGRFEARELRDGERRFGGSGVRMAVGNVTQILRPAVLGIDARDQRKVDDVLRGADDDPDLGTIGSNATLAVSIANALAAADGTGTPLWHRRDDAPAQLPTPMIQVVSGGAHAGRMIDIQDILAIPVDAGSFAEAIEVVDRVRRAARELGSSHGALAHLVGDEGGLALPFATNHDALRLVADAIVAAGLDGRAELAIDVAANQLATGDGRYELSLEGRILERDDWIEELASWVDEFPIASIEDPLADDDWSGWVQISQRLGAIQLVGDDLFATDQDRLRRGIQGGIANAVLVKPNQRGTLSDAEQVIETARAAGYTTILSARSGESEDFWLADLSVRWSTGQIKVGALARSERTAKWNRLLELEADPAIATTYPRRA